MAKRLIGKIEIDDPNSDQSERLIAIEAKVDTLLQILTARPKNPVKGDEIAQIDAMLMLRTSFPTFKKMLAEFKVKPIKRVGRLFYEATDINRILKGTK